MDAHDYALKGLRDGIAREDALRDEVDKWRTFAAMNAGTACYWAHVTYATPLDYAEFYAKLKEDNEEEWRRQNPGPDDEPDINDEKAHRDWVMENHGGDDPRVER
jgi:hypothetical protein